MTINQYLWYLEWLLIKKQQKEENYLLMAEKVSSPQSSLHSDGMPRAKDIRCRERMLTDCGTALEEYYAADQEFYEYRDMLQNQFDQLEYSERYALETAYINNLEKPMHCRKNGIAKFLGIRRAEVPELMKNAKAHLRELLISEGIEIE